MQRIMDPRSTSILNFVATKLLTVANCYKQRELVKKKKENKEKRKKRETEKEFLTIERIMIDLWRTMIA